MHLAAPTPSIEKSRAIEAHAPLVKRIANQMMTKLPPSVDVNDLIQAGLMALMESMDRYDPAQGANFETFAGQRVRGAMLDELRSLDWMPRGVRSAHRRVEKAIAVAQQELGRAPSEAEVAAGLGLALDAYHALLAQAAGNQVFLFDDFGGADMESDYLDSHCADSEANPLAQLSDARFRGALIKAIEKLPERERQLMGMYYEQDLTLKEIGAILGVTESRVSQLHTQAVVRLRAALKDW